MSFYDLEKMDAYEIPVGKLITIISKGQSVLLNNSLKELDINDSQLYILFEIDRDSHINQEQIASRCNTNKGSIARSIKKLEDNGFIERTIDKHNRRQNIISLTKKGNETLSKSIKTLNNLENHLFDDEIDKKMLQNMLKTIAIKIIALNKQGVTINEFRK